MLLKLVAKRCHDENPIAPTDPTSRVRAGCRTRVGVVLYPPGRATLLASVFCSRVLPAQLLPVKGPTMRTRFLAVATAAALTTAALPAPVVAAPATPTFGSSQPPASWQEKYNAAEKELDAAKRELNWALNEQRKLDRAEQKAKPEIEQAEAELAEAKKALQKTLNELNAPGATPAEKAAAEKAHLSAGVVVGQAETNLKQARAALEAEKKKVLDDTPDPAARIARAEQDVEEAQARLDAVNAELEGVMAKQSSRNAAISGTILAIAALAAVGVALLPQYRDKLPFDVPELPKVPDLASLANLPFDLPKRPANAPL